MFAGTGYCLGMNSATTTPAETSAKSETIKVRLMKRRADNNHHMTVVVFTVTGDTAEVYTYATWTDYQSRIPMTRDEARKAYAQLLREGFVKATVRTDEYGNPETVAA